MDRLEEIIKDLKIELRQIRNALREETFLCSGYLPLGDNDIPVKVTIN